MPIDRVKTTSKLVPSIADRLQQIGKLVHRIHHHGSNIIVHCASLVSDTRSLAKKLVEIPKTM
jgi:hypothetical protein